MWHRGLSVRRLGRWSRRRFAATFATLPALWFVAPFVPLRHAAADTAFSALQAGTLQRACWLLFPFPALGDAPYRRVVDAIANIASDDARTATLVGSGVAGLDAGIPGAWLQLDELAQLRSLADIESGLFFQFLLATTKAQLFNDPAVWELIGYEGSSLELGGYLDRGLDDIDWLDD